MGSRVYGCPNFTVTADLAGDPAYFTAGTRCYLRVYSFVYDPRDGATRILSQKAATAYAVWPAE